MRRRIRPLLAIAMVVAVLGTPAIAAVDAQIAGNTYTSPTYGFTVSWDPNVWQPDAAASLTAAGPDALDRLLLDGPVSSLYIEGNAHYGADVNACVTGESDALQHEPGVSNVAPLTSDGTSVAPQSPGAAAAAFTLTLTQQSGDQFDLANYIECRPLPAKNAVIVITLLTRPDTFADQLGLARAVMATISVTGAAPAGQATPPAASPVADPAAELARLGQVAQSQPSVAGPFAGGLVQATGSAAVFPSGVTVRDFYVRVRFTNPSDAARSPWDIGLAFRDHPNAAHFRLFIDSSERWYFSVGLEPDLASGSAPSLDTSAGGVNTIELAVVGNTGYFALNGEFVSTLDTSRIPDGGGLWIGTAFVAADTVNGAVTGYQDFQVWSLDNLPALATPAPAPTEAPPAATPAALATPWPQPPAGTVPAATPGADVMAAFAAARDQARARDSVIPAANGQLVETEGALTFNAIGYAVRDFYARARFQNPAGPAGASWDYGFIFRDRGETDSVRLVVRSDGHWYLVRDGGNPEDGGPVPSLQTGAGGVNTLELAVVGDQAIFVVNGQPVATIDVSTQPDAGDVAIASAFFVEDTVADRTIQFRDFAVWSLDAGPATPISGEAQPTAEAATPEPTAPAPTAAATSGPPATPPATGAGVALRLSAQGGSNVSGLAVLAAEGDQTVVDLTLLGATGDQVAVVHEGSCADFDPAPAFLLGDLDAAGRSRTTLNVPLDQLRDGAHVIVLHASLADFGTVVACGEIPAG